MTTNSVNNNLINSDARSISPTDSVSPDNTNPSITTPPSSSTTPSVSTPTNSKKISLTIIASNITSPIRIQFNGEVKDLLPNTPSLSFSSYIDNYRHYVSFICSSSDYYFSVNGSTSSNYYNTELDYYGISSKTIYISGLSNSTTPSTTPGTTPKPTIGPTINTNLTTLILNFNITNEIRVTFGDKTISSISAGSGTKTLTTTISNPYLTISSNDEFFIDNVSYDRIFNKQCYTNNKYTINITSYKKLSGYDKPNLPISPKNKFCNIYTLNSNNYNYSSIIATLNINSTTYVNGLTKIVKFVKVTNLKLTASSLSVNSNSSNGTLTSITCAFYNNDNNAGISAYKHLSCEIIDNQNNVYITKDSYNPMKFNLIKSGTLYPNNSIKIKVKDLVTTLESYIIISIV